MLADKRTGAVVQVAPRQAQSILTGQFAALVLQVAHALQGQRAFGEDQAFAVIQITVCQVHAQALLTYQPAATQGHGSECEVHVPIGRYLAAVTGV